MPLVASAQIPSDPVAAYSFSGNANDGSGNGNHATVSGATLTLDRFASASSAYAYNGTSDLISLPTGVQIGGAGVGISVSLWTRTTDGDGYLVDVGASIRNEFTAQAGYGVLLQGGRVRFVVNNDGPPPFTFVDWDDVITSGTYNDNQWHHIVGVFPADGTRSRIYVDGVQDSSPNAGVPQTGITVSYPTPNSYVGQTTYGNGFGVNGVIDDLYIYDRALNTTEIQTLYAVPEPALVPIGAAALLIGMRFRRRWRKG